MVPPFVLAGVFDLSVGVWTGACLGGGGGGGGLGETEGGVGGGGATGEGVTGGSCLTGVTVVEGTLGGCCGVGDGPGGPRGAGGKVAFAFADGGGPETEGGVAA